MITEVAIINGQIWTISGDDRPNALAPTPRVTARIAGVTVDIDCQYRQLTSVNHGDGCAWGIGSPCTCAPALNDPEPLFEVARDVLRRARAARNAAEDAAERLRVERAVAADVLLYPVRPGCDCPSAMCGGVCTCC